MANGWAELEFEVARNFSYKKDNVQDTKFLEDLSSLSRSWTKLCKKTIITEQITCTRLLEDTLNVTSVDAKDIIAGISDRNLAYRPFTTNLTKIRK